LELFLDRSLNLELDCSIFHREHIVTLDELFDQYKDMKVESERLMNQLADEARRFCMAAVYWNKERSFYRRIKEGEAVSIFGEAFMECVKRGLEGRTNSFSGCLCFYFPRRLLDHFRGPVGVPLPTPKITDKPDRKEKDDVSERGNNHGFDPDAGLRAMEIMRVYLDLLEHLPRFQRDALILNVSGYSHDDIAYFLDAENKKVSKEKCIARNRMREILSSKG
jgi:hypothetical protein